MLAAVEEEPLPVVAAAAIAEASLGLAETVAFRLAARSPLKERQAA